MTQVQTEYVTLSLTKDAADRLRAFAFVRNGSIHNQADAAICRGIEELVSEAPPSFRQKYNDRLGSAK